MTRLNIKKHRFIDDGLDKLLILGSKGLADWIDCFAQIEVGEVSAANIYNGLKKVDIYTGDIIILRVTYRMSLFEELDILIKNNPDILKYNEFSTHMTYYLKLN